MALPTAQDSWELCRVEKAMMKDEINSTLDVRKVGADE
jgi:hypothetical protein